jgi:hypothetical protein
VYEEVLDEALLEAIAGGSQEPQTSCGRVTVTSEALRNGAIVRIIGGSLYPESDTL